MLEELDQEPDGDVTPTATNKGENRIAAAALRWTPSSRTSNTTTLSAYSTSSRYQDFQLSRFTDFKPFDRQLAITDYALRHQLLSSSVRGAAH